jgi:uncharacterized XkdX family phage protein
MDWFKTVKSYYDSGFYTKDQVKVFVVKGKLTPEQYQEITGDPYTA